MCDILTPKDFPEINTAAYDAMNRVIDAIIKGQHKDKTQLKIAQMIRAAAMGIRYE